MKEYKKPYIEIYNMGNIPDAQTFGLSFFNDDDSVEGNIPENWDYNDD